MREQVRKRWGFSKVGNCKCLWAAGKMILTIGPDWQYNLWILGLMALVVIGFCFLISPISTIEFKISGYIILTVCVGSYILTALLNPGVVTRTLVSSEEEKQKYCQLCCLFVERHTDHCDDCEVCVKDLDHHCPYSGKCIGAGNINAFYTFLFSVFAVFIYTFFWIIFSVPNRKAKH